MLFEKDAPCLIPSSMISSFFDSTQESDKDTFEKYYPRLRKGAFSHTQHTFEASNPRDHCNTLYNFIEFMPSLDLTIKLRLGSFSEIEALASISSLKLYVPHLVNRIKPPSLSKLCNLTTFSLFFYNSLGPVVQAPDQISISNWYASVICDLNTLPLLDKVDLSYIITDDAAYETAKLLTPCEPQGEFSRFELILINSNLSTSPTVAADPIHQEINNMENANENLVQRLDEVASEDHVVLDRVTGLTIDTNFLTSDISSSMIYHIQKISCPKVSHLSLQGVDDTCVQFLHAKTSSRTVIASSISPALATSSLVRPPVDRLVPMNGHSPHDSVVDCQLLTSLEVCICDFEHLPAYLEILAKMSNLKSLVLDTKIMRFPLSYNESTSGDSGTEPLFFTPQMTLQEKEATITNELSELLRFCKQPENVLSFDPIVEEESDKENILREVLLAIFAEKFPMLPLNLFVEALCDPLDFIKSFLSTNEGPNPLLTENSRLYEFYLFSLSVSLDLAYIECICQCIINHLGSLEFLKMVNLPYMLDSPRFHHLVNTHATLREASFIYPSSSYFQNGSQRQLLPEHSSCNYPYRFHLHAKLKFYQNYYTYYNSFQRDVKVAVTVDGADDKLVGAAGGAHELPFIDYMKLLQVVETSSASMQRDMVFRKNELAVDVHRYREQCGVEKILDDRPSR